MDTPLQDEFNDRIINKTDYGVIKNITYDILNDVSSRNGIGDEWEQIDSDLQEDIIQKWIEIIGNNIANSN